MYNVPAIVPTQLSIFLMMAPFIKNITGPNKLTLMLETDYLFNAMPVDALTF